MVVTFAACRRCDRARRPSRVADGQLICGHCGSRCRSSKKARHFLLRKTARPFRSSSESTATRSWSARWTSRLGGHCSQEPELTRQPLSALDLQHSHHPEVLMVEDVAVVHGSSRKVAERSPTRIREFARTRTTSFQARIGEPSEPST